MFDLAIFTYDTCFIPLTGWFYGFVFTGDKVVQVTGSMFDNASIGVAGIIEYLHFRPCLPDVVIFCWVLEYVIDDTGVATWSDFPFNTKFEVLEFFVRKDIAAIFSLPVTFWIRLCIQVECIILYDPGAADPFFAPAVELGDRLAIEE